MNPPPGSVALHPLASSVTSYIQSGIELASAMGIDFYQPHWLFKRNRNATHKNSKLVFASTPLKGSALGSQPFKEPFASYTRALIAHELKRRDYSFTYVEQLTRAIRYLYAAADSQHCVDPWRFTPKIFDLALNLVRETSKGETPSNVGYLLSVIADRMDEHRIAAVQLRWTNPIPKKTGSWKTDLQAEQRRLNKLPNTQIFEALPEIYHQLTEESDRLLMFVVILLLCSGFRIGELLSLPADCWVEELQPLSDGKNIKIDELGNPVLRCGIRYTPEKGGQSEIGIKWLPTIMVPLAKKAIEGTRLITNPYRENAEFMFHNPHRANLQAAPDKQWFTPPEAGVALGIDDSSVRLYLRNQGIPRTNRRNHELISREELETILRRESTLNPVMLKPWRQELHESLFVVGKRFFSSRYGTIRGSAAPVLYCNLQKWLCGYRDSTRHRNQPSIFERFQCNDEKGNPLKVTSHQFRHWLNTLLQKGGLSEIEIARWSGRKQISQNDAYNHMTLEDKAEMVRRLSNEDRVHGQIQDLQARLNPVDRASFREAVFGNVHTTDLGYCIHHYATLPRTSPPECATCSGLLVPKGDVKFKQRAQQLFEEEEWLVDRAKQEVSDRAYGANTWLEHHIEKLEQLRSIVAVHEDTSIKDGDLVQLPISKAD